eukprot:5750583-Amphidinium_carterae.1
MRQIGVEKAYFLGSLNDLFSFVFSFCGASGAGWYNTLPAKSASQAADLLRSHISSEKRRELSAKEQRTLNKTTLLTTLMST